ncbi:hypothetical protein AA16373_1781 [Komagataeibacter swingsii DSM 16373]|nr:hypothetical protein AA16373_1781 [Komagataeibacter swingsii DSM 16373]
MGHNRIGMGEIDHDITVARKFGNIGMNGTVDTSDRLTIPRRAPGQHGAIRWHLFRQKATHAPTQARNTDTQWLRVHAVFSTSVQI